MSRILAFAPLCFFVVGCQQEAPLKELLPEKTSRQEPSFDGGILMADGTKQPISQTKPIQGDYDFILERKDLAAEEMGFDSLLDRRTRDEICIDKQAVEKGYEHLIAQDYDPQFCAFENFSIEDGKVASVFNCKNEDIDLRFETTGDIDQFESQWTTSITGKNALGMNEKLEEKFTLRRIKSC